MYSVGRYFRSLLMNSAAVNEMNATSITRIIKQEIFYIKSQFSHYWQVFKIQIATEVPYSVTTKVCAAWCINLISHQCGPHQTVA